MLQGEQKYLPFGGVLKPGGRPRKSTEKHGRNRSSWELCRHHWQPGGLWWSLGAGCGRARLCCERHGSAPGQQEGSAWLPAVCQRLKCSRTPPWCAHNIYETAPRAGSSSKQEGSRRAPLSCACAASGALLVLGLLTAPSPSPAGCGAGVTVGDGQPRGSSWFCFVSFVFTPKRGFPAARSMARECIIKVGSSGTRTVKCGVMHAKRK